MNKIIILVLVLLILGLYHYNEETKGFMQKTGMIVKTVTYEIREQCTEYIKVHILEKQEDTKKD